MATNPYVNKVVYGNQTVIDLTGDTAGASDVLQGQTFHDRSGALVTGTAIGGISYADNGVLGAKNLYNHQIVSGTKNGMTITVNADGTITLNNTPSATSYIGGIYFDADFLKGETIKLSLENAPSGVSLYASGVDANKQWVKNLANTSGTDEVLLDYDGYVYVNVGIEVTTGAVLSNTTIKPMIRLASDTDSTYQPYAMTNKELTDNKADNTDLDEWTATSTVDSNGVVSFSSLDTSLSYKLFYELPSGDSAYTYEKVTLNGTTLSFTTNAPNGTVCKLRILK